MFATKLVDRVILTFVIVTMFFLCPAISEANSEITNDLQQWDIVTLRADLPHKVLLYAEVQPRMGDGISHLDRFLIRPAIGYQLTPKLSVWQGYAWTPTFLSNKNEGHFNSEQRLFQQLLREDKLNKLSLTNRTRLEERFINGSSSMSVRVRHMLRLSYPICKSEKWSLVGYEELFWNLSNAVGGPQAGFDQSRTFVGLNRKISKHLSIEAGYMANYVNRYNSMPDKLNHIVLLGINMRI